MENKFYNSGSLVQKLIKLVLIPFLIWFGLLVYVFLFQAITDLSLISSLNNVLSKLDIDVIHVRQVLLVTHFLIQYIIIFIWAAIFSLILPYIYNNKAFIVAISIWTIPGIIELKQIISALTSNSGSTFNIFAMLLNFILSLLLIVCGTQFVYLRFVKKFNLQMEKFSSTQTTT